MIPGLEVSLGPRGAQLVVTSLEAAAEVGQVLDSFNAARAYRGSAPLLAVVDVAAALRMLRALAQLVPHTEPSSDSTAGQPTQWLSTAEVAERLGISERAVTKRITSGALPGRKFGRQWAIDAEEIVRAA